LTVNAQSGDFRNLRQSSKQKAQSSDAKYGADDTHTHVKRLCLTHLPFPELLKVRLSNSSLPQTDVWRLAEQNCYT